MNENNMVENCTYEEEMSYRILYSINIILQLFLWQQNNIPTNTTNIPVHYLQQSVKC